MCDHEGRGTIYRVVLWSPTGKVFFYSEPLRDMDAATRLAEDIDAVRVPYAPYPHSIQRQVDGGFWMTV